MVMMMVMVMVMMTMMRKPQILNLKQALNPRPQRRCAPEDVDASWLHIGGKGRLGVGAGTLKKSKALICLHAPLKGLEGLHDCLSN